MYFPEMCCKYFVVRTRKIGGDGYRVCCWENAVGYFLLLFLLLFCDCCWGFWWFFYLFYAKQPKGPQLLLIYQLDRLALGRVHCYNDFSLFFFLPLSLFFKINIFFWFYIQYNFWDPPGSLFLHAEASLQLSYQWKMWLLKCSQVQWMWVHAGWPITLKCYFAVFFSPGIYILMALFLAASQGRLLVIPKLSKN